MKIVINKCYGGFGLSDAVYLKLIELGIPVYKDWKDIPEGDDPYIKDDGDDGDKMMRYYGNFRDEDKRSHPLLIQAIESVGIENASGWLSKLKIVEVPDDVKFEINDYDGIESIHELHRTW